MHPNIILGLSFNTRTIGLAKLSQGDLADFSLQLRKEPWSPQKKERILTSLRPLSSYSIHSVALSMPRESHRTKEMSELITTIRHYFKQKKIPLKAYPVQDVYLFCNKAKRRKELMAGLVLLHPELTPYYQKEMRNKNKYYIKLFEAVGVATLHCERLKENKIKGKNRA